MNKALYLISLLLLPGIAWAVEAPPDIRDANQLLNLSATYIRMIGYAAAVAVIIYAGILYVTAYGNEEKPRQAKGMLMGVLIGLILILLARTIVISLIGQVSSDPTQASETKDQVDNASRP